jgi:hypothetical protein
VTQIAIGGTSGSVGGGATSKAAVQAQLEAMASMLRQLGGQAAVVSGSGAPTDPLTAPFTLYVNPYIGSDRFAGGSFNSFEATGTDDEIIAQKLKRLELQRLECGYTPHRPFKTINRAVIEAAIITSKNWYTYNDPKAHLDCVSIVLAPAVHTVYNDPGSSSTSLAAWGATKDPTIAELIAFNPATEGGILLPRGCSIWSQDLRKTTLRPNWVPAVADETANYSNRRGIFKATGSGFAFGFTFMDKIGLAASHHLLDCFHFASKAELDAFYVKVDSAVGTPADLSAALLVTRPTEYQIVGPIEGSPSESWDTTASASFYVFNCSIRSDYGIGGIFADGAKTEGLKSIVTAQFTGVSLQKDMSCWQAYASGAWGPVNNYTTYLNTTLDNLRVNPARRSRHLSCINNAFMQAVSVFTIGQAVGHWTDSGGEITLTNSNSTFGGVAAWSNGYKSAAFPRDTGWSVARVSVPLNLPAFTNNIANIAIGTAASLSGNTITLTEALEADIDNPTVPRVVARSGHTLRPGTLIWIQDNQGTDYRATLANPAWSSDSPTLIQLTGTPVRADTGAAISAGAINDKRVYIRRVTDTRAAAERRLSLILTNTGNSRLPQRWYPIQTSFAVSGSGTSRLFNQASELMMVRSSGNSTVTFPGLRSAEITLFRGAPSQSYTNGAYYRAGTVVKHANKHWRCLKTGYASGSSPSALMWGESHVHTVSTQDIEDNWATEATPIIFDTDTDNSETTTTCGINWSTVWTAEGPIRDQYRSTSDYLGALQFLLALGYGSAAAETALVPQASSSRLRDPASVTHFPTAPSGGAATGRANYAVEFRRPSTLRLSGHTWEWAGWLNYSKSIPSAQGDLATYNRFSAYFTQTGGGRVEPSGSNEEGAEVSPRGLLDITTGELVGVDDLASATVDDILAGGGGDTIEVIEPLVATGRGPKVLSIQKATTANVGVAFYPLSKGLKVTSSGAVELDFVSLPTLP